METPLYQEANQTRDEPASPYEVKLANLIHACFADGAEELAELVQGLNDRGSKAPDGSPWTEETFQTEMQRLGA